MKPITVFELINMTNDELGQLVSVVHKNEKERYTTVGINSLATSILSNGNILITYDDGHGEPEIAVTSVSESIDRISRYTNSDWQYSLFKNA